MYGCATCCCCLSAIAKSNFMPMRWIDSDSRSRKREDRPCLLPAALDPDNPAHTGGQVCSVCVQVEQVGRAGAGSRRRPLAVQSIPVQVPDSSLRSRGSGAGHSTDGPGGQDTGITSSNATSRKYVPLLFQQKIYSTPARTLFLLSHVLRIFQTIGLNWKSISGNMISGVIRRA